MIRDVRGVPGRFGGQHLNHDAAHTPDVTRPAIALTSQYLGAAKDYSKYYIMLRKFIALLTGHIYIFRLDVHVVRRLQTNSHISLQIYFSSTLSINGSI